MNSPPEQKNKSARKPTQVVVSVSTTETAVSTGTSGDPAVNRLVLEVEMRKRADAMTAVLAKIMEQREAVGHWGLNE